MKKMRLDDMELALAAGGADSAVEVVPRELLDRLSNDPNVKVIPLPHRPFPSPFPHRPFTVVKDGVSEILFGRHNTVA